MLLPPAATPPVANGLILQPASTCCYCLHAATCCYCYLMRSSACKAVICPCLVLLPAATCCYCLHAATC